MSPRDRNILMAAIAPDSPRAAEWRKVFGGERVPIASIVPHFAWSPSHERKEFYNVDVGALAPDVLNRLIDHIVEKWGVSRDAVLDDISGPHGVPILADDVLVLVDVRAFV